MKRFDDVSEPALIWTGKVMLEGRIAVPSQTRAVAVIATAPSLPDATRDEQLLAHLHAVDIAVIEVPLLTEDESQFDTRTSHYRHDTEFLCQRFIDIALWVRRNRNMSELPVICIGSSGGAAGAIAAGAQRPDVVSAVVSIDGRTDLAVDYLRSLTVPTLLVVKDMPVLRMNREALKQIRGERRIEIVHGEECAATDCVVQKSVQWLEEKFAPALVEMA